MAVYQFRLPLTFNNALPQKAKTDDFTNLLPLQSIVVVQQAYLFRGPLTFTAPGKQKAKVDDFTNLLPLVSFVPPPATTVTNKPMQIQMGAMGFIPIGEAI
jgi:hypothetical protein